MTHIDSRVISLYHEYSTGFSAYDYMFSASFWHLASPGAAIKHISPADCTIYCSYLLINSCQSTALWCTKICLDIPLSSSCERRAAKLEIVKVGKGIETYMRPYLMSKVQERASAPVAPLLYPKRKKKSSCLELLTNQAFFKNDSLFNILSYHIKSIILPMTLYIFYKKVPWRSEQSDHRKLVWWININ